MMSANGTRSLGQRWYCSCQKKKSRSQMQQPSPASSCRWQTARSDLERIKSRFKVREIKTSADIRDWNAGIIPVAVIHPASAGHGLNLQAGGSTLIWFGLTWSLELYQQTNARLWRQGQSETVVIHHIITDDTVDGRVLKALQNKEKTQDGLIAAVKAELYR